MWHDAQVSFGSARSWRWCEAAAYLSERVALQAHAVDGTGAQLGAVRVVAIAAGDTRREHLALLERSVVVDLVEHLPVGLIQPAGERRHLVRVGQRMPRHPAFRQLAAPAVAQPAGLDLGAQRLRCAAAHRVAGGRVGRPRHITPLGEAREQPHVGVAALAEGPPAAAARAPSPRGASPGRDTPRNRR